MPRFGLTDAHAQAVLAFLAWMSERSAEIRQRYANATGGRRLDLARFPWFEYP